MDQLTLSRFGDGDLVQWWDARGQRTGRFVRVISRGRHRGQAEVAIGGTIAAARIVRVPLDRLSSPGDPEERRAQRSR